MSISEMSALRVGVMGAGLIGTFVGGKLASAGATVTLVGRARTLDPIRETPLRLCDLDGPATVVSPGRIRFAHDPQALSECDIVLLCTKSSATRDAAQTLSRVLPEHVAVVSLQNGVENPKRIRDVLGLRRGYGGMVSFNVVQKNPTTFQRTTTGPIIVERMPPSDEAFTHSRIETLANALRRAGVDTHERKDFERVAWSKLLFNLNNAINALSGLPLREQLSQRAYRKLLAQCISEGLAVMKYRGTPAVRLGRLYAPLAARVLPLPDPIFSRLAGAMLRIDPNARSSMYEDLSQGRRTEIDDLNGAVVRHGESLGVRTPVNARIVELVRDAEQAGRGSPMLSARAIGN
jgi:2-dehydropantoate 2-reductase